MIIAVCAIVIGGCSSASVGATATHTVPTTPHLCNEVTPLFLVGDALTQSGELCQDWLQISYGRVINGTTGSATVWSRRSEFETGVIVGAVHTLGLGWLGPADTEVAESFSDPAKQIGVPRLFLVRADGSGTDDLASFRVLILVSGADPSV